MNTHYFVNGKPAPPSEDVARKRVAQLDHEITRLARFAEGGGVHKTAAGNLGWLREEKKMLLAWLAKEEEKPFWGTKEVVSTPRIVPENYDEFWED